MKHQVSRLLKEAALAVRESVSPIPVEERGREVAMGADGEPTTAVDDAAERALISVLCTAAFPLTLVSEESGEVDLVPGPSPVVVLADPVDSTKNAIAGLPLYATALAAYVDGEPLASVVMNLATGDSYEASRGEGALLNGRLIRRSAVSLEEAIIAFGPVRESYVRAILARLAVSAGGVRLFACPSLGVADVGAGRLGGFLGLGTTGKVHRLFDIAASVLFAEEAGAVVTDREGQPLRHEVRDLTGTVTVIAAPGGLHEELVAMVAAES